MVHALQLYQLSSESEISIKFCYELCSISTNQDEKHFSNYHEKYGLGEQSHQVLPPYQFLMAAKMNGTQKMTLASL